jgi:hypothetical protein
MSLSPQKQSRKSKLDGHNVEEEQIYNVIFPSRRRYSMTSEDVLKSEEYRNTLRTHESTNLKLQKMKERIRI